MVFFFILMFLCHLPNFEIWFIFRYFVEYVKKKKKNLFQILVTGTRVTITQIGWHTDFIMKGPEDSSSNVDGCMDQRF